MLARKCMLEQQNLHAYVKMDWIVLDFNWFNSITSSKGQLHMEVMVLLDLVKSSLIIPRT